MAKKHECKFVKHTTVTVKKRKFDVFRCGCSCGCGNALDCDGAI